jgi:hypothetical protein
MADDGNQSVFTGTFLRTGQAVMVCEDHLVAFCIQTLSELSQVPFERILAVVSEDVATTAEGAPSDEPPPEQPADGDPPHPSRTRKGGRGQRASADRGTGNGQPEAVPDPTPLSEGAPAE